MKTIRDNEFKALLDKSIDKILRGELTLKETINWYKKQCECMMNE